MFVRNNFSFITVSQIASMLFQGPDGVVKKIKSVEKVLDRRKNSMAALIFP